MSDVTIVIPTHNRRALLSRTLRSALEQCGADLEVVVVDDGSSDDTTAVVSRFADPRVRLLHNPHAQGVSAARNRGIAEAAADWIAFLDDDDLWAPHKLACQLSAAEREGRGWAVVGAVSIDSSFQVMAGEPLPSPQKIREDLPWRNYIGAGPSSVLVRKTVLDEVGSFDPQLRLLADWELWIRLGEFGPPAVVNEPLVAYLLHAGNSSAEPSGIMDEMAIIEERYAELRGGAPMDWPRVHRYIAWHCLRVGRRSAALRAYARAIAAGDVLSVGRAVVALLDPNVARRRLRQHRPDAVWEAQAKEWLRAFAEPAKSALAHG